MIGKMDDTLAQCEALLYSEGGEMSRAQLTEAIGTTDAALPELVEHYNAREGGLVMLVDKRHVLLRPAPRVASLVQRVHQASREGSVSKAGLEVLAIILYKGSATVGEVEYIRGVGSTYTLRQLTARGLVHRHKAGAGYRYTAAAELMALLGITSVDALPEYATFTERMRAFEEQYVRPD